MRTLLNFRAVALTLLVASASSYILCILGDLFLGWTMYRVWSPLLPGFTWPLTTGGFVVGLVWLVAYSLYGGVILVLPYNYLMQQQSSA